MSISATSNISGISNYYNNQSSLIQSLTGQSDETSSSVINSVTNLDSYVSSSLSSVQTDSTYSAALSKEKYNISDLTSAVNAFSNSVLLTSITSLDSYVNNTFEQSQLSVADELSSVLADTDSTDAITNVNNYVTNAYKSYSYQLTSESSIIDIIK